MTLSACGLSKEGNFLQAQICECGCGKYAALVLRDRHDVAFFIHTTLAEHECCHSAVFAAHKDGGIMVGVKLDNDDVRIYTTEAANSDVCGAIADFQSEFQFHCYGLLEQVADDLYDIVMD